MDVKRLRPPTAPAPEGGARVIDLRPQPQPQPLDRDESSDALVRAARGHATRAVVLRQEADREAVRRSAAVLALHVLYGCSTATLAHLLGTTEPQARAWLQEGRRRELASG